MKEDTTTDNIIENSPKKIAQGARSHGHGDASVL
jgi:hypothetical protein